MFGVVCLTAAVLGAPAASEGGWRSKEVSGVTAEGETLQSLVVDLALRTRTPIHLVFEDDTPVIHDIDTDLLDKPYVQVAALRTKKPGKIEWIMMPYPKA